MFPFEIEHWPGTAVPSGIGFEVSAELSPTIDVTRSLLMNYLRHTTSVGIDPEPEHRWVLGEVPGSGPYDSVTVEIEHRAPASHPRLAEAVAAVGVDELAVYVAYVDSSGAVIDVLEPTPVTLMLSTFEHIEVRGIPTQLADGTPAEYAAVSMILNETALDPLIWAGSATRTP